MGVTPSLMCGRLIKAIIFIFFFPLVTGLSGAVTNCMRLAEHCTNKLQSCKPLEADGAARRRKEDISFLQRKYVSRELLKPQGCRSSLALTQAQAPRVELMAMLLLLA